MVHEWCHVQIFADTMTTELLIDSVSMLMSIVLNHLSNLVEMKAWLAVLNRQKHGISGHFGKSFDVIVNLCRFVFEENHG